MTDQLHHHQRAEDDPMVIEGGQADGVAVAASPAASASAAAFAPLLATFRTLVAALGAEAPAHSAEHLEADLPGWCMAAIQLLTSLAPAVRPTGGFGASSSSATRAANQEATRAATNAGLVLPFLNSMLQAWTEVDPRLDGSEEAAAENGRPLLPFLYANLFKYCLRLGEYDVYYHALVGMPSSFAGEASLAVDGGEHMKLEYLKRFVIELLREGRVHDIVAKYAWSFPWSPVGRPSSAAASSAFAQKSVREEVEQMLWWHAKSSDIQDELSAAIGSAVGMPSASGAQTRVVAHYETLHAFLLASHRYVRAAQAALHYFYRLESEVQAGGGLHAFIARRVSQAQKGKGRVQHNAKGAAAHTHSEQSIADTNALTLDLLRALLERKLWALRAVQDALERAAPEDEATAFMVEDGGRTQLRRAAQQDDDIHGHSPLHKRSRAAGGDDEDMQADQEDDESLGRIELLSRSALARRLEMLLAQFDLCDAMALGPAGALLPPLADVLEFPNSITSFVGTLVHFGLIDRAFHFVQCIYAVPEGHVDLQKAEHEAVVLHLFGLLADRVVRLAQRAAILEAGQEEDEEEEHTYPLRMEDSLQAIQLSGVGGGFAFAANTAASDDEYALAALQLRQAEAVLQHLLRTHDTQSMRGLEMVAEAYLLQEGLELPIWLPKIFTAFMKDQVDEEDHNASQAAFRNRDQALPTGHATTLQSFPFLSFLRLLLSFNQFELLHVLSVEYLDWLARPSTTGPRELSRATMVDVLDGFLFLASEASGLEGADGKSVRAQVKAWIDTLTNKIKAVDGAAASTNQQSTMLMLTDAGATRNKPQAAAPAFGGGFTSRFAPAPTAAPTPPAAASFTSLRFPASSGSSAVAPAASPFASPFASDVSAAAAPSFGFGGGGFGAAPSSAITASPFKFGAPSTTTTPAKSAASSATAGFIFQALNKPAATEPAGGATGFTPFSFGQ